MPRTWKMNAQAEAIQQLQKNGELSPDVFESLGRADLDELLERFPPEEQKLLLQCSHGNPQHSLMISSFPELTARLLARKQNGLEAVEAGWWIIGVLFVIVGAALLADWHVSRGGRLFTVWHVVVAIAMVFILASLMLPAVQSAREASNRNSAKMICGRLRLPSRTLELTEGLILIQLMEKI